MKTNFQMLRELDKEYTPLQRGVVTMKEIYLINERLCLDEMDILQLRNLRDFVVLFYVDKQTSLEKGGRMDMVDMDKMSAITTVIDDRLFRLGAEV